MVNRLKRMGSVDLVLFIIERAAVSIPSNTPTLPQNSISTIFFLFSSVFDHFAVGILRKF